MSPAFPEADCLHFSTAIDKDAHSFIARMRFHQSWYRHRQGWKPGPNPHAACALYGNMLCPADGAAGRNFLRPDIFAHAKDRFPPSLGREATGRLYDNLLGSQPMCFNLFGPLKTDRPMGTELMRALPGFPADAAVDAIVFEDAPGPNDRYLNDLTSFDCFMTYTRPGGARGFIGIETKLTEPFSQKRYAFHEGYARWHGRPNSPWKGGVEGQFSDLRFNQLWRNHLLVYAMLQQPKSDFTEGFCAVVYPEGDRHCVEALSAYRKLLTPQGSATLLDWPLEQVMRAWKPILALRSESTWLAEFDQRYVDLSGSEDAWQAFRRSMR